MEKDIHMDSGHIQISKSKSQKQPKGRKIYWSEGMIVETYVDAYSEWIKGTITRTNNASHSVEIELDTEQDTQNIGKVHIIGKEEQTKIRADPDPIINLSSRTPKHSILKNPSPVQNPSVRKSVPNSIRNSINSLLSDNEKKK
eukprot:860322_1